MPKVLINKTFTLARYEIEPLLRKSLQVLDVSRFVFHADCIELCISDKVAYIFDVSDINKVLRPHLKLLPKQRIVHIVIKPHGVECYVVWVENVI